MWVSIIPVGGIETVGKIGKRFKTISKIATQTIRAY
jgi:hypothetical protein